MADIQLAKLVEFERAVYNRKRTDRLRENQDALEAMLQCLRVLRDGWWYEGFPMLRQSENARMASAILALFLDPGFKLTQQGFDLVAAERGVIECVFKAGGFDSSDFIPELIPEDAEGVNKYLLLYSVDSKLNLDFEPIFRGAPQETIGLYFSLIGYAHIFTKEADALRERLIELSSIFEHCQLPAAMYNALSATYMHCSYAHGEHKHDLKRMLHRMMHDMVAPHITLPTFGPQARKERPTIFVLSEWWNSKHAMYRSYAKSIEELREDFRLIGACPSTAKGDPARDLFDGWMEVPTDPLNLAALANSIIEVAPDIIYYPSIGMSVWGIAMASLRLAPIQVMTYGHPATSNSPVIDYGVLEEDFIDQECFSEEMVPMRVNTLRQTPYQEVSLRHVPRRTECVRIGISAMQVKISMPFLRALRAAQVRATKKVEVQFFCAASGIGLYSMANELGKILANVTIQEKQDYPDYIKDMSQCDMMLFSFPFGGWNSTIDAMMLGLPVVSMFGKQPHARTDTALIRRAGLPSWLVATTEEEYTEAIVRLFDDDERIAVANQVAAVDMQKLFFDKDGGGSFLECFRHIYRSNTMEKAA